MIAIDTSALVCILMQEEEAELMARAIEEHDEPIMSAASMLELMLIMLINGVLPPGQL